MMLLEAYVEDLPGADTLRHDPDATRAKLGRGGHPRRALGHITKCCLVAL